MIFFPQSIVIFNENFLIFTVISNSVQQILKPASPPLSDLPVPQAAKVIWIYKEIVRVGLRKRTSPAEFCQKRSRKGAGKIFILTSLLQTPLLSLHVIASPKGVAISSFLGLLRRSASRNDTLLISLLLIRSYCEKSASGGRRGKLMRLLHFVRNDGSDKVNF